MTSRFCWFVLMLVSILMFSPAQGAQKASGKQPAPTRDVAYFQSRPIPLQRAMGSAVEWHQDLPFFPHTNDDLVTTLIYLDDATKDNGCLQVMPRMHSSYLEHVDEDGYFTGIISQELEATPVPLEGRAGSVIFMHPLTPHGSLPNTSPHARRTLIFEFRAADSFPIYFGELTHRNEQTAVHVQGDQPRTVRVGGPTPVVPILRDAIVSIYDLQERSKGKGAKQPKFAT